MAKTLFAPIAALAIAAAPAHAAITTVVGAPGVQTDENVLFQNIGPADAILTTTNKGTRVTFTGQEALEATAGGQAKISGADGQFNSLNFFATDPSLAFSAVEFSLSGLNGRGAPDDVFATIRFFDQFGTATTIENAALGNGQSWFAAFATLGSAISRVEIATSADIRDARHFRIATSQVAGAIPEPATWLMLIIGFGAVGGALRHRGPAGSRQRLTRHPARPAELLLTFWYDNFSPSSRWPRWPLNLGRRPARTRIFSRPD